MAKKVFMILTLYSVVLFSQQPKTYSIQTIAFYNLENLFDIYNDPNTFDDDRTPLGKDHWTDGVYRQKLKNMAYAISKIGNELTGNTPVIIGVSEVENRKVLEDLVKEPALAKTGYGIVHFDSPDRRGIDVALLYQKTLFRIKNAKAYELFLYNEESGKRIYTRDQLVVSGYLDSDLIHVIVNHWPSRRGGEARSRHKREKAARLNKKIMDSLFAIDPYSKIISMGDFNDTPFDTSIKKILNAKFHRSSVLLKGLYNPMMKMSKKGVGSHAWKDRWSIFDQILISKAFLNSDYTSYKYFKAGIFNEDFLSTQKGRYKGYPFRSMSNSVFTGGYSDHFPVYMYIIKQRK